MSLNGTLGYSNVYLQLKAKIKCTCEFGNSEYLLLVMGNSMN